MRSGLVDCFFFQAEDGIRDLVRSRGLGDVYKRQNHDGGALRLAADQLAGLDEVGRTSDAGRVRAVVDLSLIHI